MPSTIRVTVDDRAVLDALRELGPAGYRHLLQAAKETATNILREAQGRVARRTGETMTALTMAPARAPKLGYRVFVGRTSHSSAISAWLEYGTQNMSARPFLFASAQLEEGPHRRRVDQALADAIVEATS